MVENIQPSIDPKPTLKLWSPNVISAFTFFLGFPSGITLASINWFKMGLRRKALLNIFATGLLLILLLLIIPDKAIRGFAFIFNLGYLVYIRNQMQKDFEKIPNTEVQNSHWFSGLLASLLGTGVFISIYFLFAVYPSMYYYKQGNIYSDRGDYEKSIESYNQAIQLDPEYAYAYHNRGIAYAYQQEYENAIADYSKAIELDPYYDRAYCNRALAYKSTGQFDRAIQDLNKVLEVSKDQEFLKFAEDELQKLTSISNSAETDSMNYYNSGEKLYQGGNYLQAIDEFTKAIGSNPDFVDAYHYRAIAYVRLGKYDLASTDLDKAVSLKPDDANLFYIRGLFYKEIGDFDRALADQNKAIDLDPEFVDAFLERGIAHGNKGNYENALADFNKAIELDPFYALPYNSRGYTYLLISDYENALSDFNKALRLDPNLSDAYLNRGILYGSVGNHQQALADFNKVIEINPNESMAYFYRGLTYEALGQIDKAIKDLEYGIKFSNDPETIKSAEEKIKKLKG